MTSLPTILSPLDCYFTFMAFYLSISFHIKVSSLPYIFFHFLFSLYIGGTSYIEHETGILFTKNPEIFLRETTDSETVFPSKSPGSNRIVIRRLVVSLVVALISERQRAAFFKLKWLNNSNFVSLSYFFQWKAQWFSGQWRSCNCTNIQIRCFRMIFLPVRLIGNLLP